MTQGLTFSGKRARDSYIHHHLSFTPIPDIYLKNHHRISHATQADGIKWCYYGKEGGEWYTCPPLGKNTPINLYKLNKLFNKNKK